jgi:ABC-2 type transport system ATP-binding protein
MTAIIQIEKLTKTYGAHRGIVDIDLEVNEGEAFGFLGPNGAGKTTTIRTLLDHIRPTSGRARVFGIETTVDPVAFHRRVGYLPGEFTLCDKLTGSQTIEYFANLRGGVDAAYQAALVDRLDIDPSRKFKELLRWPESGSPSAACSGPARPDRSSRCSRSSSGSTASSRRPSACRTSSARWP